MKMHRREKLQSKTLRTSPSIDFEVSLQRVLFGGKSRHWLRCDAILSMAIAATVLCSSEGHRGCKGKGQEVRRYAGDHCVC